MAYNLSNIANGLLSRVSIDASVNDIHTKRATELRGLGTTT